MVWRLFTQGQYSGANLIVLLLFLRRCGLQNLSNNNGRTSPI